jgi:ATP-binding cassette subfamily B protein
VPQQGLLFSGTIDSNIAFGTSIEHKAIEEAAKVAQAENFIFDRPGGYQAPVSQKGGNLSGGQRQRISIARAIAAKPQILLFDDSFSALDYKTELKVRSQLFAQHRDATILVVSQRISSIMHADAIVVLDEGHVVGLGTHKELMSSCNVYQQIAHSQLSAEEINSHESA